MKGFINRILPFSCVDGPGNRSVVFFQGCNFKCIYCHNPETIGYCILCSKCIEVCPSNALSIKEKKIFCNEKLCCGCDKCIEICPAHSDPRINYMSIEQIINIIEETSPFISGVTFSGGECTLQLNFLHHLVNAVNGMKLDTCVDTNGSIPLWEYENFVDNTSMFILDIKSYHKEEHNELTKSDNSIVLENFKYLSKKSKLYEVRTVVVPEILNNKINVYNISKMIAETNPDLRYKLIRCQPHGLRNELLKECPPKKEYMNCLKKIAEKNGCKNIIIT